MKKSIFILLLGALLDSLPAMEFQTTYQANIIIKPAMNAYYEELFAFIGVHSRLKKAQS